MHVHFRVIGVLLMILSFIHIFFPTYFNWKEELQRLSLINRQMMTIHTFFIALTVFLMGLLCITSSTELVNTKFGKTISLGFGVFWSIRLFIQVFGYSKELWAGKAFETVLHFLFCGLWLYLSVIFLMNYLS